MIRSRMRYAGMLSRIIVVGVAACILGIWTAAQAQPVPGSASAGAWDSVSVILKRIAPPQFPPREVDVTAFGARGDAVTDCTAAFARAIDSCSGAGGGRVVVPAGVYVTGPVRLKSNVNLYVARGAVIRFSPDPSKYLPVVFTRWEGVECMNYSPLVYAYRQENIAITGEGSLDGGGSLTTWWKWKGTKEDGPDAPTQAAARKRLFEMAEEGVPPSDRRFGDGSFLRPSFFQPYECRNVLVQGVTFTDAPMWFVHPVLCSNVSIIGVKTAGQGPNNDGCDPESCRDVLISDCVFDNGDDCIAIKSGRNSDGRRINRPSENIVIRGCTMRNGHGGVVVGSEVSGGVRNVYAEGCVMESPNLERALRIKTNAVRGGVIENVRMRNVRVRQVTDAVVKIDYYYEEGDSGCFVPVVRDIGVSNVESGASRFGLWIRAFERSPATRVVLENCDFRNVESPNVLENVKDLTLMNVRTGYRQASPPTR